MKLSVIAESATRFDEIVHGWGISLLIGDNLLMDTFGRPSTLKKNLKSMRVGVENIKQILITHEHNDHINGLWYLLEKNPSATVYICPSFSKECKDRINSLGSNYIELDKITKITECIYSTGEMTGTFREKPIAEQSLIIVNNNITVISGCAHTEITMVIKKAIEHFNLPVGSVIGGFHLHDKDDAYIKRTIGIFKDLQVRQVAPCHCTGKKAVALFKNEYKDKCKRIKSGIHLDI
jgi:7,8-dihydropterin-6-yl-methyl-4-(beta-D-ribofuranosyl)aminobenzene 5'-phosphate synthase